MSPYCAMGASPFVYSDPDGDEPITLAALAIGAIAGGIGGYQAGKAAGATGWQMFGYIAGGAAIGTASGYLSFSVGAIATSAIGTVGGSAVAGAVGGATNSILTQLAYTGNVDFGIVGMNTLYGLGGGAASGLVDASALASMQFPMHHTAKHIIRSTAFQIGGNLAMGDLNFSNVNFGLDVSIIAPLLGDVAVPIAGRKIINSDKIQAEVKDFLESYTVEYGGELTEFDYNVEHIRADVFVGRSGQIVVSGGIKGKALAKFKFQFGSFTTKPQVSVNLGGKRPLPIGPYVLPRSNHANLLNTIYLNKRP